MRDANARAVAAALERFGRLDVVVPNAGVQHVSPVDEFPEERWQTIVGSALEQPVPARQARLAGAARVGGGRFIAIASVARARRLAVQGGLRLGEARRHGPDQDARARGRRATGSAAAAVCPGYVRTPLVENRSPIRRGARHLRGGRARTGDPGPARDQALIEPDEVAAVVAFLAGPGGGAFTGVPVTMDYGWTAR